MAITMGGITTALASFSVESDNEAKHAGSGPVTKRTTQAIVLMLLPISIGMIAYALFTFFWRSRCMERKQVSMFHIQLSWWHMQFLVLITLYAGLEVSAIKHNLCCCRWDSSMISLVPLFFVRSLYWVYLPSWWWALWTSSDNCCGSSRSSMNAVDFPFDLVGCAPVYLLAAAKQFCVWTVLYCKQWIPCGMSQLPTIPCSVEL